MWRLFHLHGEFKIISRCCIMHVSNVTVRSDQHRVLSVRVFEDSVRRIVVESWEVCPLIDYTDTDRHTCTNTPLLKGYTHTYARTHALARAQQHTHTGSLWAQKKEEKCATLGASFKGRKVEEDRGGRTKGRLGWKRHLRYFLSTAANRWLFMRINEANLKGSDASRLCFFFLFG